MKSRRQQSHIVSKGPRQFLSLLVQLWCCLANAWHSSVCRSLPPRHLALSTPGGSVSKLPLSLEGAPRSRMTPLTRFYLRDSISILGHIHRYWELDLEYIFLGGQKPTHNRPLLLMPLPSWPQCCSLLRYHYFAERFAKSPD